LALLMANDGYWPAAYDMICIWYAYEFKCIGSRFIHIRYWVVSDFRDNVVCILVFFACSTHTIGSCILNPMKLVPRPSKIFSSTQYDGGCYMCIYVYIENQ